MASSDTDKTKFQGEIMKMFYNLQETNINIAKAEMLTILKYIFAFYDKDLPKKKAQSTQTDNIDLEAYKKTAKRLIINSD